MAAPPASDEPASRQPIAVKPAPERARPAVRTQPAETPPPNPGDLICGNCGIGNDPARKFCRRCGNSLATAVVHVVRIPWYRRIFRRKPKAAVAAGTRPKSMRMDGSAGRGGRSIWGVVFLVGKLAAVALVVGAIAGYALVPSWKTTVNGWFDQARQVVAPTFVPVLTSGQATGPAIAGHPAQAAFDGFSNRYWAAKASTQPVITASFSPAANVAKILVTSGASDNFNADGRPRDVLVEFLDAQGNVITSKTITLTDSKDPQTFDVSASAATKFRLTVQTIYPGSTADVVAITEIEFRARQ